MLGSIAEARTVRNISEKQKYKIKPPQDSPFALAIVVQFQLRVQNVHFHLITSRYDLGDLQDLFQVGDRAVGHSDRLDLARGHETLHGLPGLDV
jgi:hypothetical protein